MQTSVRSAGLIDVLIIGSGFGGAIPAFELARAGMRVTLLERGPWRDTLPVRSSGISARSPLPHGAKFFSHALRAVNHRRGRLGLGRNGLLELFLSDNIGVLCSSGVGGGSHVYGGVHMKPTRQNYWDCVGGRVSSQNMAQHYDAVLALMGSVSPIPPGHIAPPPVPGLEKLDLIEDIPQWEQTAWGFRFPEEAGQPRLGGINGMEYREADMSQDGTFGAPGGGKVSLDAACLIPALEHGLEVKDGHEVTLIERQADGTFGVHARNLRSGKMCEFRTGKVVVAAGTMNSLKLLLHSRQEGALAGMPELGKGFSGNGDLMAFWPVGLPEASERPPGLTYIRLYRLKGDREGPLFFHYSVPGLDAIPMPGRVRRKLQSYLVVAAMGIDAANGTVTLNGNRLHIAYEPGDSAIFEKVERHFEELGKTSGIPLKLDASRVTAHPLGGARAGTGLSDSVVNDAGEVHDIPGLYITDGSAMPQPVGGPPSLSIGAWAHHVATGMIG